VEYNTVVIPALIGKSKTTEGIVQVFLPPILPGLNKDLPSIICNVMVLSLPNQSSYSLDGLNFWWLATLGTSFRLSILLRLAPVFPKKFLSPEFLRGSRFLRLWFWSPTCFDHIEAANFDRSAPCSAHPILVTLETLLSRGALTLSI